MLLLQGRTFEKFNFSSVNQVSSVVLCSLELAFFQATFCHDFSSVLACFKSSSNRPRPHRFLSFYWG